MSARRGACCCACRAALGGIGARAMLTATAGKTCWHRGWRRETSPYRRNGCVKRSVHGYRLVVAWRISAGIWLR